MADCFTLDTIDLEDLCAKYYWIPIDDSTSVPNRGTLIDPDRLVMYTT